MSKVEQSKPFVLRRHSIRIWLAWLAGGCLKSFGSFVGEYENLMSMPTEGPALVRPVWFQPQANTWQDVPEEYESLGLRPDPLGQFIANLKGAVEDSDFYVSRPNVVWWSDPNRPGYIMTINFGLMDLFSLEVLQNALCEQSQTSVFAEPVKKPQIGPGAFLHRIREDRGVLFGRWLCGVPKVAPH